VKRNIPCKEGMNPQKVSVFFFNFLKKRRCRLQVRDIIASQSILNFLKLVSKTADVFK